MTDTVEFENALNRVGITKKEVAKKLGISEMGLYKKVHNITEFKASEIDKLYTIFRLTSFKELRTIFFANNVEFKSTKRG